MKDKKTLKEIYEEYCEEIKQTPDFRNWHHRFNLLRRILNERIL